MIEQATTSLIDLIKTVAGFSGRVGASVGGTDIDPTAADAPIPYAWVIFDGDQALDDGANGKIMQQMKLNFVVHVVIPHGTEAAMKATWLPFIESVSAAVRGKDGPTGALKWKYEGQILDGLQSEYIRYEQHYSVIGHYK